MSTGRPRSMLVSAISEATPRRSGVRGVSLPGFPALLAPVLAAALHAVELEAMIDQLEAQLLGHAALQLLDVLVAELDHLRSEEHTSELQSLMRISYAVFCLKKKKNKRNHKIRQQ